jgi:hypothetical protein
MRGYRYTFLDRDGQVRADIRLKSPSDEAAFEIAEEMLPVSGFTTLELRRGVELIYCMGRTDADESSQGRSRSRFGVSDSNKPLETRSLRLVPGTGHFKDVVPGRC